MTTVKIDFHIHSSFSNDSRMKLNEIIGVAKKRDLQGIFICDHDNFKIKKLVNKIKLDNFFVLVGMEIKTEFGEIITCFHDEDIKSRRYFEIIDELKDKNGYVIIPHPLDNARSSRLDTNHVMDLIKNRNNILLALEAFNSRCIFNKSNNRSRDLALKYNLGLTAGSDAHFKLEIGNAYTIFSDVTNEEEIINAFKKKKTTIEGKLTNPIVHFFTVSDKLMKKFYKKVLRKDKDKNFIPI